MSNLDLLGGARRGRTRPRGFIDWAPHPETQALIDAVQFVLDEYRNHLPLTARQFFTASSAPTISRKPSATMVASRKPCPRPGAPA